MQGCSQQGNRKKHILISLIHPPRNRRRLRMVCPFLQRGKKIWQKGWMRGQQKQAAEVARQDDSQEETLGPEQRSKPGAGKSRRPEAQGPGRGCSGNRHLVPTSPAQPGCVGPGSSGRNEENVLPRCWNLLKIQMSLLL